MKTLSSFLSSAQNPNPELIHDHSGETSGGETPGTAASSRERETISEAGDGEDDEACERERKKALMEKPPTDDVCPICFGNFDVPCRAPCGHWYCGSCILQYWSFSAALQPCKCPMCSQCIMKLIPEASLLHSRQAETSKVLEKVGNYNRLFVGGIYGFMLKVLAFPLYIKRMLRELMNPDRPGVYLNEMRVIAVKKFQLLCHVFLYLMGLSTSSVFCNKLNRAINDQCFDMMSSAHSYLYDCLIQFAIVNIVNCCLQMVLGVLCSFAPFDFIRKGRRNIIDLFDYSAFALSFIFYLVGVYRHWRRERNIRELVDVPEGHD